MLVQIKPADADRFLATPDPAIRVVLIYGNDEGLVAERAERFATAVVGKADDPFAHVRLESAAIADDPGRLADEANAVPLFGGQRAITVRLSGNASDPAGRRSRACRAAGRFLDRHRRRRAAQGPPLRRLCENSKAAAAIACYADGDRDLDRIIDEETRSGGLDHHRRCARPRSRA